MLSTRKASISLLTCSPNFLHTALGKHRETGTTKQPQGKNQQHPRRAEPQITHGLIEVGNSQHSAAGFQTLSILDGDLASPSCANLRSSRLHCCTHQSIHNPHPSLNPTMQKSHRSSPQTRQTKKSCKVVVWKSGDKRQQVKIKIQFRQDNCMLGQLNLVM